MIHVHDDARQIGRNYAAAHALIADPILFLEALAAQPGKSKRAEWTKTLHEPVAKTMAWSAPADGLLDMGPVVAALAKSVEKDAIFVTDAGNFAGWLHRHFRYKGFRTQLGSTNGSMGYGYPAAVAAKLAAPQRTVLGLCGDGDFLMNGQEIATAAQYGAAFVALVVNNGMYGTIRMHQEREYPGRVSGTELKNPDFAAYARAFGGHGETVEKTEDFAPAYERAASSLIEGLSFPDDGLEAVRQKSADRPALFGGHHPRFTEQVGVEFQRDVGLHGLST